MESAGGGDGLWVYGTASTRDLKGTMALLLGHSRVFICTALYGSPLASPQSEFPLWVVSVSQRKQAQRGRQLYPRLHRAEDGF